MTENEILNNLVTDYTARKQTDLLKLKKGMISKEVFLSGVKSHLKEYYKIATPDKLEQTLKMFEEYVFGYGVLSPLLDDKDISDIRVVSYDNIRIKREGKRTKSDIVFLSESDYRNFINFVATKNEVSISNLNAIQRFTDNDSHPDFILRFTITMPLVNTYNEPYLSIRKVPKDFPLIDDLIKKDMLDRRTADMLQKRFCSGSTLICGGNSSGKTTLLNALKETLPYDISVLVTQQADELTTKLHPDMMFMHSLPETSESKVQYDLENISIAGLTMDVDFFIVGEVKGAEAIYLLNAAYTGQLCAATVHAPSADKATDKIVDYALYNSRYSPSELLKMMSCFNTVIFMKGYKVQQVYEVVGWDEVNRKLQYKVLYERGGDMM